MTTLQRLLAALVLVFLHSDLEAQSATASLGGIVIDETGAVVPDVTVTVLNRDTGWQRAVTTGSEGGFAAPLLPPGRYTLRAQRDGFTPLEVPTVVLNVNDQLSMTLRLKVAALGESVSVVAQPARINTSGAVGTVIDRQFVDNLPLNGRTFQTLIALTPGVVVAPTTPQNPGQLSVNGQRTSANQFTIDGVSANFGITNNSANGNGFAGALPAMSASGGTNALVSVEALEEFRVQTSTYAPEFGRTPGGQVQVVTRSGTNTIKGSLFEYFRNDALDANDWFANAAGTPKPELRQHNFGGVLGGPLRRNALFFFGSYEGLRLRQPTTVVGVVPSMDFRASATPAIRPLLDGFPIPNGPDLVDPLTSQPTGTAQFTSSHSDSVQLDAFSLRLDHQAFENITLFGRYNESPSSSAVRAGASSGVTHIAQDLRTFTAGMNATLGGRWLNETRLNYSEQTGASFSEIDAHLGAVVPSNAALYPEFTNPDTDTIGIQVGPASGVARYFAGPISTNRQRQVQLIDTVNAVAGAHSFKLGLDYRMSRPTRAPAALTLSQVFRTSADVRDGRASSVNNAAAVPTDLTFHNVSLFAQDTWAMTRRLSLTYGVRWDLNPPAAVGDGKEALTLIGLDDPQTYALAPRGAPVYETRYADIAPRVGASYRLRDANGSSTVLRGGAGLFYDLGTNDIMRAYSGYPFSAELSVTATPFPLQGVIAARPVPPTTFTPPYNGSFTVFPEDLRTPRTWQWNATVEQEASAESQVVVSYVGAHGERLLRQDLRSRPNPNFGSSVTIIRSDTTSDYRALQMQFKRRLSHGLQAYAAYTLAESIDEVSDTLTSVKLRGPSNFDIRHVFNLAFTYMLPRPQVPLLDALAGGWSINGLGRWQSAPPVNVTAATNQSIDGVLSEQRPNLVSGIPIYIDDPGAPGGRVINATVDPTRPGCVGPFCSPPAGVQGDLGRNQIRGYGAAQVDVSLRRTVRLHARTQVLLAIEAFNLFNRANFGPPVGSISSGQFGRPTAMLGRSLGGLSPLYQIGGPRSMQLIARVAF